MSKLSVVLRASTGAARPNLRVRVKNVDTDAYVLDTDDDTLVDNGDGSYTSATDVSAMVYSVYTGDTATLVNGYEERFHPGEGESIGYEIGVDVQAYDLQLDQVSAFTTNEVTRLGSLADIAYTSANLFPVMSSEGWSGMSAATARSALGLGSVAVEDLTKTGEDNKIPVFFNNTFVLPTNSGLTPSVNTLGQIYVKSTGNTIVGSWGIYVITRDVAGGVYTYQEEAIIENTWDFS